MHETAKNISGNKTKTFPFIRYMVIIAIIVIGSIIIPTFVSDLLLTIQHR